MSDDYIVPDAPPDVVVEVVGVGLFLNDKSERLSEHPAKEDQVPTWLELQEQQEEEGAEEVPPPPPLDIEELSALPVEEEPEEPADEDTSGGDQ